MAQVHASACVGPQAKLGEGVRIGPFCVLGPDVELADNVVLHSHVVVDGRTRIGTGTRVSPFASLGQPPQNLQYRGEPSELVIGADNIIREYVTMNTGTEGGGMVTRVGNDCMFMVGAHVGHDCRVSDRIIMANNATLGGHVTIGDSVMIGGLAVVHQYVRVGQHAMIGGLSAIARNIIPFGLAYGDRARLIGLNLAGLKRNGFTRADVRALKSAYDLIFAGPGTMADRLCEVEERFPEDTQVSNLMAFIRDDSSRTLCWPKASHGG
jgi:UDP-N-acetylglucosamine acyltransferase